LLKETAATTALAIGTPAEFLTMTVRLERAAASAAVKARSRLIPSNLLKLFTPRFLIKNDSGAN
jgi:hypothetical protein